VLKDDFKPASVVKSDQGELTVGSMQDVSITLPNAEVRFACFSVSIECFVLISKGFINEILGKHKILSTERMSNDHRSSNG